MEVIDLLILAKNGDEKSKEKLIDKYYGLIIHQTKPVFLNGYTFEDLIQTGVESVLKAINSFDINKGIESFNAYIFWSIKNNFNYLCRNEIRHSQCLSLNIVMKDDMESIDLIESKETLEEIVFKTVTLKELRFSLQLLDKEELELISFLYLNDSTDKKQYLSKYAQLKGKDYYYCTNLKKRALEKLKSAFH
ncbi:sigma-70 family RNA polymerase sigma factor [Clostridium gasigenes]|uniref:RNA polymerase sigma factor, sigma-70 family n=1 Tax=Clostridium gasigenes TaxID=94869 RepID=A0A1H0PPV7_9CLOT|nr:sigma-70 family RNA polymerase sigma factor [Clostridium gasigenes]SDP07034.1 RNA polymerase sigma factor, sigma-70 family [Clostridium gasigenes]